MISAYINVDSGLYPKGALLSIHARLHRCRGSSRPEQNHTANPCYDEL